MEDMLIVWLQDLIHKNVRQQALAFYEFLKNQSVGSSNETFVASIHYINEPTYDECVRSLLRLAREIGGEGFDDMNDSDVTEITRPAKELTAEEIHDILHEQKEDEEDENKLVEEPVLKLATISRIVNSLKDAIEEAINSDPIMTRSLRFKYDCEVALKSYEELYKDLSRRAKQKTLTQYFNKV